MIIILPMIAASTKRLSRLHTIMLTPRGVGRSLWRGPPRGGWGGSGGGGTFKWYARVQRPTFPWANKRIIKSFLFFSLACIKFSCYLHNYLWTLEHKELMKFCWEREHVSNNSSNRKVWPKIIERTHMGSTWSWYPYNCTTIPWTGNNVVMTEPGRNKDSQEQKWLYWLDAKTK